MYIISAEWQSTCIYMYVHVHRTLCYVGVTTLHQVMKIRQMLTEVLLDVTNHEIGAVAAEAIEEAKSELY